MMEKKTIAKVIASGVLIVSIVLGYKWNELFARDHTHPLHTIEKYLAAKTYQTTLSMLFPEAWTRICFVPGNYNPITQKQLDEILGHDHLIQENQLANDGYDIFMVTFNPKPHVQKFTGIYLLNKAHIVCSSHRNTSITLGVYKENIKSIWVDTSDKMPQEYL